MQLKWDETRAQLAARLGRACSDAELAEELGLMGGEAECLAEMRRMTRDKDRCGVSTLPRMRHTWAG